MEKQKRSNHYLLTFIGLISGQTNDTESQEMLKLRALLRYRTGLLNITLNLIESMENQMVCHDCWTYAGCCNAILNLQIKIKKELESTRS